ncbi:unnamed protein product, partial [marine sediment metagenome]
ARELRSTIRTRSDRDPVLTVKGERRSFVS